MKHSKKCPKSALKAALIEQIGIHGPEIEQIKQNNLFTGGITQNGKQLFSNKINKRFKFERVIT